MAFKPEEREPVVSADSFSSLITDQEPVDEEEPAPVQYIPAKHQNIPEKQEKHQNIPEKQEKQEKQEKYPKELKEIEEIILEPDSPKEKSLEELRKLVENTLGMGLNHTHSYTGDRQWNDAKCPICRAKAQKAVFETKEQISNREKFNDRAIMTLALEIDKEHLKKAKDLERARHETEISNSQHNYESFLENVLEF